MSLCQMKKVVKVFLMEAETNRYGLITETQCEVEVLVAWGDEKIFIFG